MKTSLCFRLVFSSSSLMKTYSFIDLLAATLERQLQLQRIIGHIKLCHKSLVCHMMKSFELEMAPDLLTHVKIFTNIHNVDIETYTTSVFVLSTPVFQAPSPLIQLQAFRRQRLSALPMEYIKRIQNMSLKHSKVRHKHCIYTYLSFPPFSLTQSSLCYSPPPH